MVATEELKGIQFFAGLDIFELEQIARLCEKVQFLNGDKILNRSEQAEFFYIVTKGKVNLCFNVSILSVDREIVVDTKHAGDVFGWSALMEPYMLTLSAYCDEDCELIRMPGRDVLSLCQEQNHIGFILMRNLGKIVGSRLAKIQFICEREIELNVPSFEGNPRREY